MCIGIGEGFLAKMKCGKLIKSLRYLALLAVIFIPNMANAQSGIGSYNSCNLLQYFQFIFQAPYRDLARDDYCRNNIPPEFFVYQTQVGNTASSGRSSIGAAAAASASGISAASGLGASETFLAGTKALGYAPDGDVQSGAKAIDQNMDGKLDDYDEILAPLEKSIWLRGLGSIGAKNATAQDASVRINSAGLMTGADLFSNEFFRFGVLGSVRHVDVDINENNNEIQMLALTGGATATLEIENWYLDAMGTFAHERYDTKRTVDINGAGDLRRMWSEFDNNRIDAAFETGFRFTVGRAILQPLAGVNLNWLYQSAVQEQGNTSAAIWTDENVKITGNAKLGAIISTAFYVDDISFSPAIGGHWTHRFGEIGQSNRISTTQGVTYEYVGSEPPKDLANLYASLTANMNDNLSFTASYSAAFNHIERNHSGSLGISWRW